MVDSLPPYSEVPPGQPAARTLNGGKVSIVLDNSSNTSRNAQTHLPNVPPYTETPRARTTGTLNGGSVPIIFDPPNEATSTPLIDYTPAHHRNPSIPRPISSSNNSTYTTPQKPSHFPPSFGIYHASGTSSDLVLALKNHDPNPLFYITTHSSWSSKPNIILHSGGTYTSPHLATALYTSFSSQVEINILAQSTGRPILSEVMRKDRSQHNCQYFNLCTSESQPPERFEWKNSKGIEVQRLNGRSHGMKLVRVKTGEVVVAWAPPNSGSRKMGKMAFLNKQDLGPNFGTMAVITILAIMGARGNGSSASGAAAGAGFAAGAAGGGGGGGC